MHFRAYIKGVFVKKFDFTQNFYLDKTSYLVLVIVMLSFVIHSSSQAQYPVRSRDLDKKIISRDTMFLKNSIIVINTLNKTNRKPARIALKNNLLYDVALLPNLSIEAYLGAQMSLAVNGHWSWWTFDNPEERQWFHRIQSVGAELRYWINSPSPLIGHAIGIYGTTGNYDLRLFPQNESSKGWLSNRSWSTGLSYAYSVPISCYFNMEFGFSIGYVGGKYNKYNYCIEDEWWAQQTEKNRHYFGPTHAGVSLVWMIGSGSKSKSRDVYFVRYR